MTSHKRVTITSLDGKDCSDVEITARNPNILSDKSSDTRTICYYSDKSNCKVVTVRKVNLVNQIIVPNIIRPSTYKSDQNYQKSNFSSFYEQKTIPSVFSKVSQSSCIKIQNDKLVNRNFKDSYFCLPDQTPNFLPETVDYKRNHFSIHSDSNPIASISSTDDSLLFANDDQVCLSSHDAFDSVDVDDVEKGENDILQDSSIKNEPVISDSRQHHFSQFDNSNGFSHDSHQIFDDCYDDDADSVSHYRRQLNSRINYETTELDASGAILSEEEQTNANTLALSGRDTNQTEGFFPFPTPEYKGRPRKHPYVPGKYPCNFCGWRCAKPSVLKKHIRSHTNERPYPCKFCQMSFKTKSNLSKHEKSKGHLTVLHDLKVNQSSTNQATEDVELLCRRLRESQTQKRTFTRQDALLEALTRGSRNRSFNSRLINPSNSGSIPISNPINNDSTDLIDPANLPRGQALPGILRYQDEHGVLQHIRVQVQVRESDEETLEWSAVEASFDPPHVEPSVNSSLEVDFDDVGPDYISTRVVDPPDVSHEEIVGEFDKRPVFLTDSMILDDDDLFSAPQTEETLVGSVIKSQNTFSDQRNFDREVKSLNMVLQKPYVCEDCNMGFRHSTQLQKHLRSRTHLQTLPRGQSESVANTMLSASRILRSYHQTKS